MLELTHIVWIALVVYSLVITGIVYAERSYSESATKRLDEVLKESKDPNHENGDW